VAEHGCNGQPKRRTGEPKEEGPPRNRSPEALASQGLTRLRGSQTGRKRGGNELSKRLRSLARANPAGRFGRPGGVPGCGRGDHKCMKVLRQSEGDRSMTAGPRSRQAGLRVCDRAKSLGKRVCGLGCKRFSSPDQDHAKHVGQGGRISARGWKDQQRSHTRPPFDRLGIRLLFTAPFGVRSSRLPCRRRTHRVETYLPTAQHPP
jgi:hypothetical protein